MRRVSPGPTVVASWVLLVHAVPRYPRARAQSVIRVGQSRAAPAAPWSAGLTPRTLHLNTLSTAPHEHHQSGPRTSVLLADRLSRVGRRVEGGRGGGGGAGVTDGCPPHKNGGSTQPCRWSAACCAALARSTCFGPPATSAASLRRNRAGRPRRPCATRVRHAHAGSEAPVARHGRGAQPQVRDE